MDKRSVQRLLAAAGYYGGGLDGDFGPKSQEALKKLLERNKPAALAWSSERQRIAGAQIILNAAGYEPGEIDGFAGHNTQEAYNAWEYFKIHGKQEILPGRDVSQTPLVQTPLNKWPKQNGVASFYGKAGNSQCTAGIVTLPFAFRLAWDKSQKKATFNCHLKVASAFETIFTETARHYGEDRMVELGLDLYGGCYNYRAMRGGTTFSMHAYGIAYDTDPERNQLRWGSDRAELAKPVYEPFWKIVQSQGALSLGRARNYDWMHFQFANL